MGLNLFPVRVPIGQTVDSAGKKLDVLMTPEFARAMTDLLTRVGGDSGMGNDEIASYLAEQSAALPPREPDLFMQPPPEMQQVLAEVAMLRQQVQELTSQILDRPPQIISVADIQDLISQMLDRPMQSFSAADIEQLAANPALPADWEHPGKIGYGTANKATFTLLNTGAGTVGAPSFYLSTENTTGFYRTAANSWGWASAGALIMTLSATGAVFTQSVACTGFTATGDVKINSANSAIRFQLAGVNKWAWINEFPAAGQIVLYDHTAGVSRYIFSGTGLAITGTLTPSGAFGCNGKSAQTAYVLGAAATDPASTQTLANNLRLMAIANGIGQ